MELHGRVRECDHSQLPVGAAVRGTKLLPLPGEEGDGGSTSRYQGGAMTLRSGS